MPKIHPLLRRSLQLCLAIFAFLPVTNLQSQTPEDGIMLSRGMLCTGVIYTHDRWDHYWEGPLMRTNGNLGTVSTDTVSHTANFAVLNRLNVFATTPYVWTGVSQGVLHSQQGFQDISLAVKYQALRIPLSEFVDVRAIAAVSGSIPLTNYEADIQPVSIGLHSKTIAPRATVNIQGQDGYYANATAAYDFRDTVKLEVPYYYTNGQLYLSNQVSMPNQVEYNISAGYYKHDLLLSAEFLEKETRGGGDIRRQDMPFISNRMNSSRGGFRTQFPLPKLHNLQFWFADDYTFRGRNVGRSNTITTALMYTLHFRRNPAK